MLLQKEREILAKAERLGPTSEEYLTGPHSRLETCVLYNLS